MEKDAGNSIKYYVCIPASERESLADIRHWSNIKTGVDGPELWLKDLDYAQAHSKEVKSLASKSIYFERGNQLYFLDSKLPERSVPSLLFTPIDRSIPVSLPSLNHNYFGIKETLPVRFVESNEEHEASAMVVDVALLATYMDTAPAVRTNLLRWCLIGKEKALVTGRPLLPLPGNTYWSRGDSFIPTGLDFELHVLIDAIHTTINSGRDKWLLWSDDSTYTPVLKSDLATLSRSSVKLSVDLAR